MFSFFRKSNEDKVFVALPETYEDQLSVLSWVFSYFPQDKTKIIITHVMTSPLRGINTEEPHPTGSSGTTRVQWLLSFMPIKLGLYDPRQNETKKMDLALNKYLSHCATYKFRAEKLVHMANDIAEGIVQVIAEHGIKNLVMGSAEDIDTMGLASETANKVMRGANLSCKLWFVSNGNLIFTREVNSDNLTPALTFEMRSHRNGRPAEGSSSISARSNSESTIEEMLHEASIEAGNFKKMAEDICGGHVKMTHIVNELANNLQRKEQEIRELKEILQREKQEKDQLRLEIEENKHEYFNQIEVADKRRLELEKQVSDFELIIKERDNLVRKVEELCIQKENMHRGSSTTFNSEFSLQELEQATQNFSDSLKIGEGGFGPVYKGSLHRTTVAIKLLHSQSLQGISQFQQEITILTKVRHPNLVTLIGSCSEVSALIYEYLSNGSLEDRLTCANNTQPLTWQTRTRIIGEICLALIFLHSNKPQLVVHGDLKPENILLDTNLVSKLSDFGISRLLKQPDTDATAFFQTIRPAGTFSYIDPEYLSTGILTPKSDIYSFGIIILRLLTGKPPLNIAGQVQDAMRDGILLSVIDESAGTWPFEEAKKLATIALRCAELSRKRRPDLINEVWPVVEPLMKAASTYVEPQSRGSELGEESIPSYFICPIFQEVMRDPCIAADGFTYEADAIRQWFRGGHNTSPMTNLELPHHNLIPNHVVRSAIVEWRQQHPHAFPLL